MIVNHSDRLHERVADGGSDESEAAFEQVLAQGRFGTDRDGYSAMLKLGRQHKDRIWAVEGCNGIGRHIAQRLVADGETVLDVSAKLSARARLFDTAQARSKQYFAKSSSDNARQTCGEQTRSRHYGETGEQVARLLIHTIR